MVPSHQCHRRRLRCGLLFLLLTVCSILGKYSTAAVEDQTLPRQSTTGDEEGQDDNERHRHRDLQISTCPKYCGGRQLSLSEINICTKCEGRTPDGEYQLNNTDDGPSLVVSEPDGFLAASTYNLGRYPSFRVVNHTNTTYGQLNVSVDGSYTYTPDSTLFCGRDTFQFTAKEFLTGKLFTKTVWIMVCRLDDTTKPQLLCEEKVIATAGKPIPLIVKSVKDMCGPLEEMVFEQTPIKATKPGTSIVVIAKGRDVSGNVGSCLTEVEIQPCNGEACAVCIETIDDDASDDERTTMTDKCIVPDPCVRLGNGC